MKQYRKQKYVIWEKDEYHYPKAGAFIPFIMAAVHEDEQIRPAMLVAPGGAYAILQPGEADFQAKKFFERGYNTFVLCYTNDVTLDEPVGRQSLRDISRAVQFIRKNHKEFRIDVNRVYASGYSAGGHLVASLAVHHEDPMLHGEEAYQGISNRLDAVIAHYPLVSRVYGEPLFRAMLGDEVSEEELDDMSLEKHVTKNSSPIFLLHGESDALCPPQNSLMLALAYAEQRVPHEIHLIQNGDHGVTNFDSGREDAETSFYVYEQLYETVQAMSEEELEKYRPLYGKLSKEMSRNEFYEEVFQNVMNHIFAKAVSFCMDKEAFEAVGRGQKKVPESVKFWRDMVDDWLEVIR